MQRWTPRRPKSKWSLVNKNIALRLIAERQMRPMGLAAVEAAKASGEWDRAYTVQKATPLPPDLREAIEAATPRRRSGAAVEPHAAGALARMARRHRGRDAHAAHQPHRARTRVARLRSRRRSCPQNALISLSRGLVSGAFSAYSATPIGCGAQVDRSPAERHEDARKRETGPVGEVDESASRNGWELRRAPQGALRRFVR